MIYCLESAQLASLVSPSPVFECKSEYQDCNICTRYRLSTQHKYKFLMKRDPKGQLRVARYSNLSFVLREDQLKCSGM